jgi:CxxC motif-containing protein (DUF1111 family)
LALFWMTVLAGLGSTPGVVGGAEPAKKTDRRVEQGKELFERTWVPNDPRSHGGDGLGPVFNERSCVACHNRGATGGAGRVSRNAQLVTAFSLVEVHQQRPAALRLAGALISLKTGDFSAIAEPEPETLIKLHGGFRNGRSTAVHRFAVDPGYEKWRQKFLVMETGVSRVAGEVTPEQLDRDDARTNPNFHPQIRYANYEIVVTERNPTALFGTGLIDALPDRVLEDAAKRVFPDFPGVKGRVCRLRDGRIGRFGWKAQTATLEDFVLTACAIELGLEVPGHPQANHPQLPPAKARGLDLTADECASLTAFVRSLPPPSVSRASTDRDQATINAGRKTFETIGCATCHTSSLGGIEGIYSDLLLHDMGEALVDSGMYAGGLPDSPSDALPTATLPTIAGAPAKQAAKQPESGPKIGAMNREWRTPPLWGFANSSPYMHDGRTSRLESAIELHGGEASVSRVKYLALAAPERQQLANFLESLVAPADVPLASR